VLENQLFSRYGKLVEMRANLEEIQRKFTVEQHQLSDPANLFLRLASLERDLDEAETQTLRLAQLVRMARRHDNDGTCGF